MHQRVSSQGAQERIGTIVQKSREAPVRRGKLTSGKRQSSDKTVSDVKGIMSPQAHARVDEKHFEIVGPTFPNNVGEFKKLFFICLNRVHEIFFYYKRSLVITEAVCCDIFESFCGGKAKTPRRVVFEVSHNPGVLLYCDTHITIEVSLKGSGGNTGCGDIAKQQTIMSVLHQ